jgi:hypothetical protein
MDWIDLALDRGNCRDILNAVVKLQFPSNRVTGNFH